MTETTGVVKKLTDIRDGYFQINQVKENDKQVVRKNDREHLDMIISKVCKSELKSCQEKGDKLIFQLEGDTVNDFWEVIPKVRLVEYDYKISELKKKRDTRLISVPVAKQMLAEINCSGFKNQIGEIEKINMTNWGYAHYILKNSAGRVLAKVDDYEDKPAVI